MMAALWVGFVGTAVAVLLFVLVSDAAHRRTARGVATITVGQSRWARFRRCRDAANERRAAAGPPAVAKEVIRAMAHTAVYRLEEQPGADDGGDESDTGRWARRLLAGTCEKLDGYLPGALELERIVDAFCGRANATCDTFEANLREYRNQLALITEARISLERELNLTAECRPAKRQTIAAKMDDCPTYPPATDSSVPCSSLAAEEEDYVLSGYSYLIGNDSVDDNDDDDDDDDDNDDDDDDDEHDDDHESNARRL